MMSKSLFQRIFVYYAKMVVLWILAEFDSSDAADALALALCLSVHRTSISHRARVMA
ncbi:MULTISPECIES: hypothetical protein [unclassified Bartonella]|uniref:hypothetical protein n=1 Tax=unclassified Bartonella TaxID=2645622 RepID=UPI0023616D59|nr:MULTISPECIES: hypothetical protein [unclassified Bartonella]